MTIFSKAKNALPPVPGRCSKCGADDAAASLQFIASEQTGGESPLPRPIWLCPKCQEAARVDGKTN